MFSARLRDPTSLPPLAARESSRNLSPTFYCRAGVKTSHHSNPPCLDAAKKFVGRTPISTRTSPSAPNGAWLLTLLPHPLPISRLIPGKSIDGSDLILNINVEAN